MPKSAKLCLPLLVANQSGWVLSNPQTFTATWDGGHSPDAIRVDHPLGRNAVVRSHFGGGILTWSLDYLFRTPPGWNLWVRGPVNHPKDGASPLEGVVETDWADSTFTMNWKLTRPGHTVRFEAGEPYCVVLPQRRGELEAFQPQIRDIESDPATATGARKFVERRKQSRIRKFLAEYSKDFEADWDAWEKDYFKGRRPDGSPAPEHQTKLRLAEFEG